MSEPRHMRWGGKPLGPSRRSDPGEAAQGLLIQALPAGPLRILAADKMVAGYELVSYGSRGYDVSPPDDVRRVAPTFALRRMGTLALANNPGSRIGSISGLLAPYNSRSGDIGGFREIYEPGCFGESLKSNDDILVLFNHNVDHVLGRRSAKTARFYERPMGLFYEADLPDTQVGRDLAVLTKRGDIRGSSAAFFILSHRWEQRDGMRTRIIEQARLIEGSPCVFPAYESSTAAIE